jgi:serine/threonine-protein kinase RsbW
MNSSSQHSDDERLLKTIVIPSDLAAAREPEQAILKEAQRIGFSEDCIFAIKLTLEEAITNAIKHGNKCDSAKKVTVRYAVDADQVVISIRDEGAGFDPGAVPDPTQPERISLPNGRGILLMRAYMSEVTYRCNGTEIFLRKRNE